MSQDSFSLSHAMPRIGGVLLAAGRGRRFDPDGKRHKLLARLGSGDSLVRVSAMQLLPWVDTLTVVVGAHNTGLVRELADLPLQVVVCEQADAGPGATLRCGLGASVARGAMADQKGLLVSLADMPFIAATTYETLREMLVRRALARDVGASDMQAWRAQYAGQPGHPVALTTALARHYLQIGVDPNSWSRGLSVLWRAQTTRLIDVPTNDPGCVRDVDVPEDLWS